MRKSLLKHAWKKNCQNFHGSHVMRKVGGDFSSVYFESLFHRNTLLAS